MPSAAREELEQQPITPTTKKRRRDGVPSAAGGDAYTLPAAINNDHFRFNSTLIAPVENRDDGGPIFNDNDVPSVPAAADHLVSGRWSAPRKVLPLPASKRFRLLGDDGGRHHQAPGLTAAAQRQDVHSPVSDDAGSWQPRTQHDHRQQEQHQQQQQATAPQPPSRTSSASSSQLAPCHICHRKPTKKSDLDSYADCLGCGRRTCYVCIRECHGWDGGLTDARLLGANGSSEMDINFVDAEDEGRRHNGTDGRREEGRSRREEEDGAADRSFTMQDAAPTPHPFYFEFSAAERDGQQIVQSRGVDGQDKERRIGEEHAHHGGDAHHRRGQQDYDHDMTISSDVTGTVVSPDDDWTRRGHQPMICSRCCIERGPEGDVVCLGCVAAAGGVV